MTPFSVDLSIPPVTVTLHLVLLTTLLSEMHISTQHWVEAQEQVWKDSVERHGLSDSVLHTREFMIRKNLGGGEALKGYRKHLIVHHRFLAPPTITSVL